MVDVIVVDNKVKEVIDKHVMFLSMMGYDLNGDFSKTLRSSCFKWSYVIERGVFRVIGSLGNDLIKDAESVDRWFKHAIEDLDGGCCGDCRKRKEFKKITRVY